MLSARCGRYAALAAAFCGCASILAQETSLEPAELAEAVGPLPAVAEPAAAAPVGADDTEEVVVRGRSSAATRGRLVLAEDKLYSIYNEINTIEEFDIHCRMHAETGTRIPQRICLSNFQAELNERKAQAVLAAMRGEVFGTDWQQAENEMQYKAAQLEEHMRRLALEHPELREAMREVYEAMQAAAPRRYGRETDR